MRSQISLFMLLILVIYLPSTLVSDAMSPKPLFLNPQLIDFIKKNGEDVKPPRSDRKVPTIMKRIYEDLSRRHNCQNRVVKSIAVEVKKKNQKRYIVTAPLPYDKRFIERTELWLEISPRSDLMKISRHRYYVDMKPKDSRIEGLTHIVSPFIADSQLEFGLNITKEYDRAKSMGKDNFSFRLTLHTDSSQNEELIISGRVEAYLIFYAETALDYSCKKTVGNGRFKRSPHGYHPFYKKATEAMSRYGLVTKRVKTEKVKKRCRRKKLHIEFHKIGWSNWLIYPYEYQAYRCSGACHFPQINSLNATNHALVQSLTSSMEGNVPAASCVPYIMEPLTVLTKDEDGVFTVSQFSDMIVVQCSCL